MQETDNRRLGFFATIFECADKSRHIGEISALSEKPRNFDIGVYAVLELAIDFKEEFVVKKHRRVALLPGQNLRFAGGHLMIRFEHLASGSDQVAGMPFHDLMLYDRLEQLGAKLRIPDRIEQNRFLGTRKTRDDRVRGALRNSACSVPRSNLYRNRISFGGPI